ncbi:hypothetical protein AAFN85_30900 [Mucilaginibacter sp. CAU 1740]|uniref:hypothetical protein n=1 Tax=Mucilaginibacter sp. CAU 1740 TaxID=3140365 RepID=UPI00325B6ACB
MKPNTLLIFLLVLTIVSCKKDNKPTKPKVTDIYLAGAVNRKAAYWKNGELVKVDTVNTYSPLISIAVQGDDVYTLGLLGTKGYNFICWKNGKELYKGDPDADAIPRKLIVSGNDVYILADVYATTNGEWRSHPTVFKNGIKIEVIDGVLWAGSTSMALKGNDIYVTGFIQREGMRDAYVWKNGNPIRLSNSKWISEADAITIQGNDIYIAGTGQSQKSGVCLVWKNQGVADTLVSPYATPFSGSSATGIAVNGNDVYVGGMDSPGDPFGNAHVAHYSYWKNGVYALSNSVSASSSTYSGSAFYYNNNLYTAGSIGGRAGYWKDLEAVIVSEAFSEAYDILIVEH